MTFFFFHVRSSFQGFEDQPLFQRQNFFPETFANIIVVLLNFASLQMLYMFFPPPISACVLTQSYMLPVTHAAKHTQLIHPFSRTCDTPAGLLAPPTRGRGWYPVGGVSLEEMNLAPQH